MSKFILIDQSLKKIGGHHYEYAVNVLHAAEAVGFEPVIASYRHFQNDGSFPPHWPIFQVFRHHSYNSFNLYGRNKNHETDIRKSGLLGAFLCRFGWWGDIGRQRQRKRHIDSFVRACQKLFRKIKINPGDHVFFPTLTEFDLLGLVEYLKTDDWTRLAQWHLQFHFNFLEGREPDYAEQDDRLEIARRIFKENLRLVPKHSLHFYCTTEQMATQYNRMGVATFESLPYPINDAFQIPRQGRLAQSPLRVTCTGALRMEKSFRNLAGVVNETWEDLFATGKIQLLVQSNKSWFRLPVPENQSTHSKGHKQASLPNEPIVYVSHPLNSSDYVNLIRRADIGLMMYDSKRYYARYGGVLSEMLSAGVPVIVPAGCWLAEQIAEPIYCHLDDLHKKLPIVGYYGIDDISWQKSDDDADSSRIAPTANELTFGDKTDSATCTLPIPENATDLLVSFHWIHPTGPGTYVRLQAEQYDAEENPLGSFTTIVGHRSQGRPVPMLVHVKNRASRISLTWNNAYHDARITLADLKMSFLSASEHHGGSCPAGAVGLIAAATKHVPDLLREMVVHYEHYRKTADAFSNHWVQMHNPQQTISKLIAKGSVGTIEKDRSRAA